MVEGCGVELVAVAPWQVRPRQRGDAVKGWWQQCLFCSGVEGGRRRRVGRVGQKVGRADRAARLSWAGKAS
jgi:hypothetical protein